MIELSHIIHKASSSIKLPPIHLRPGLEPNPPCIGQSITVVEKTQKTNSESQLCTIESTLEGWLEKSIVAVKTALSHLGRIQRLSRIPIFFSAVFAVGFVLGWIKLPYI